MTPAQWFSRPQAERMTLRKPPRLASWRRATDPGQIALGANLDDTVDLASSSIPATGAWGMWLAVGLPASRALTETADLDNYALPLASRLANDRLISGWCIKSNADGSHLVIGTDPQDKHHRPR